MVESALIDLAHHIGMAAAALDETLALEEALEAVLSVVSLEDTLVVVTADHAHTLAITGYQERGTDITSENLLAS